MVFKSKMSMKSHTSDSTGFPKILVMTHAWAVGNFEMMGKEPPPGFENVFKLWQGNRVFAVFPAFHVSWKCIDLPIPSLLKITWSPNIVFMEGLKNLVLNSKLD